MKRTTLLLPLLIIALIAATSSAALINSGSHILSFGIMEGINLSGTADFLVTDTGSTQGSIRVEDNATLTMLGGRIEQDLVAVGGGIITIKGGTIGQEIKLDSPMGMQGDVYIYGTNFAINGVAVGPGRYHQTGIFTGTLENGDILNNMVGFAGGNDVVLIPEPATMLLLTMGTLYLRRRKTA